MENRKLQYPSQDPLHYPTTINTNGLLDFQSSNKKQPDEIINRVNNIHSTSQFNHPTFYMNQIQSGIQQDYLPNQQVVFNQQSYEKQQIKVVARNEVENVWRVQQSQLERQVRQLQIDLDQYRNTPKNAERLTYIEDTNRIQQLNQEVNYLQKTIVDLNDEAETWRDKYNSLEQRVQSQGNVQAEIKQMKQVYSESESLLKEENDNLQKKLDEMMKIQKQRDLDFQYMKQNQKNILNSEQAIMSLQSDLKNQKIIIQEQCDDNIQLNNRLQNMEDEYNALNKEYEQTMRQFQMKEREIKEMLKNDQKPQFQQELQRLQGVIQKKEEEIEKLKKAFIVNDKDRFERENNRSNEIVKAQQKELEAMKSIVKSNQVAIRQPSEEREGFLLKEVEVWRDKYIALNRSYHKLQEEQMSAYSELEQLRRPDSQFSRITK